MSAKLHVILIYKAEAIEGMERVNLNSLHVTNIGFQSVIPYPLTVRRAALI